MTTHAVTWSILWPAFIAGSIVAASHVPLGMQVLRKGIVFIDLAIAQIAGLGVVAADALALESGTMVQISALIAAIAGSLLLTWSEKKFPEVQEAIIGVAFVLAATAALILLTNNPHGAEHMKDILVGQILWVNPDTLWLQASISAIILAIWFGLGTRIGRVGFYVLFACAVTMSVQLVGLYLVFATLIMPALATREYRRKQLLIAYIVALAGYALGLALSAWLDWPSGPVIVWTIAIVGILAYALRSRRV
ncbi:MAG: metal ABC transporter permease [Pseudomonadota bacterium]|nr:metal ABC transporter permease [Pseudomonadota bacterium]